MSDDLAVGGPGTVSVLTTALAEEAHRVSWLESQLEDCRRRLLALDRVVGNGILAAADAPRSALLAEAAIDEASVSLARASEECGVLVRGVAQAARGYEQAELFANRMSQEAAAGLGYILGSIAPILVALFLPGAVALSAAWLGVISALPERERSAMLSNLKHWVRSHAGALSDPGVVQAVRLSVMSADDAGWGLVRVPQWISSALGDEGIGLFGVDTSAVVVAGLAAGVGLARETSVKISAGTTVSGVSPAAGVQDRIARIPPEPEQVRVDRYSAPRVPDRFEVYIAGTAELDLASDYEPWDMTSNLTAMSGGSSGSLRATLEAMRDAGIDTGASVTITGYSQGGLIASQIAASGDYSVDGLLTVGAPSGQVAVPHDIPYLAIEHSDDLVPALGGTFASSDPVVVRRQVFDDASPLSGRVLADRALPAHKLSNYLATAELVDQSTNVTISEALARFEHSSFGDVTSTIYRAERVSP